MTYYVKNRRAQKVIELSKKASDQYEYRALEGIGTFREALLEAEKINTDREKMVCICKLNLAVAHIHFGTTTKHLDHWINDLEKLLPVAKQHCYNILEDIWYYIALALKLSKEGPGLSKEEAIQIRDTLYKAKEYSDEKSDAWSLAEQIIENLLIFEKRESKRTELLERMIAITDNKGWQESDLADEDHLDLRMQRACECLNILLKTSFAKAKNKAESIINWRYKLKNAKQDDLQVSTWCDLGLVLCQLQEYYQSRYCFSMAASIAKDGTSVVSWVQIQHNIAAVCVLDGSFLDAIRQYTEELPKFNYNAIMLDDLDDERVLNNPDLASDVYMTLAFSYLQLTPRDMESLKSLKNAYRYYAKALKVQWKNNDHLYVFKSLEGMVAAVLAMERSPQNVEREKLDLGLIDCEAKKFGGMERVKKQLDIRMQNAEKERAKNRNKAGYYVRNQNSLLIQT